LWRSFNSFSCSHALIHRLKTPTPTTKAYGIAFSRLLCLNNMPIKRFADYLTRRGELASYMATLVGAFNPATADGVMCRGTVNVGWDGALYDCDFNAQLAMPMTTRGGGGGGDDDEGEGEGGGGGRALSVFDIASLAELGGRRVRADSHCFGCTAGAGSSCQGATAVEA
jgi:hypothetical protein